jgi:uncharacterized membrane protein
LDALLTMNAVTTLQAYLDALLTGAQGNGGGGGMGSGGLSGVALIGVIVGGTVVVFLLVGVMGLLSYRRGKHTMHAAGDDPRNDNDDVELVSQG